MTQKHHLKSPRGMPESCHSHLYSNPNLCLDGPETSPKITQRHARIMPQSPVQQSPNYVWMTWKHHLKSPRGMPESCHSHLYSNPNLCLDGPETSPKITQRHARIMPQSPVQQSQIMSEWPGNITWNHPEACQNHATVTCTAIPKLCLDDPETSSKITQRHARIMPQSLVQQS